MKELKAHSCEDALIFREDKTRKKKCANCEEFFTYTYNQVIYMIGKNQFCSWKCKCAFQRKLDEEKRKQFIKEWRKS